MRGKGAFSISTRTFFRITPAYAGKRRRKEVAPMSNRDHPRVCGEKRVRISCSRVSQGSPPRVRGKGLRAGITARGQGITPACAGKSPPYSRIPPRDGDHPRVCGEKSLAEGAQASDLGSPPRVRGKAPINRHQAEEHGITLAYAGKSCPPQAPTFTRQDHPRVCGEKCPPGKFFFMTVGSPPRVRGKALPAHACPAA